MPGLVTVATITLALGIGANTAIFSVIYSALRKPLVFPQPDRLVQVAMAFPSEGSIARRGRMFTTIVAIATGFVTGLMPAVQTARGNLVPALREGERGVAGTPRQQRLRATLVGAEVALTLALLVGAGLLIRSFSALRVDRGFQTEGRVRVEMNLPQQYCADEGKRAQQFVLDFESCVRSLPGSFPSPRSADVL